LGVDPLNKNEELNEIHYDLAASVQKSFEDICFHLLKKLYEKTNCTSLVFSGGCAYNCSLNGKIDQNTNFNNVFIPPFPDDSGVSIGSALYLNKVILKNKKNFVLSNNYLGPNYDNSEIKFLLNSFKIKNRFIKNPEEDAAKEIESGKIIGWFQGKIEFGDRSLGNRSILADPRDKKMKDKVNNLIKYRESFRPFAPSILEEHVGNFFKSKIISPFMSKTKEVKKNKQNLIPAVVHHDGSARLQSVSQRNNPRFYKLLKYFFRNTGVPMLLNTSFNVQGEPIVCSPQDALRTFFSCGLDILYLENFKIEKK
jgi:carbamoyltransferase